jgi:hypothetical protein
MPGIMTESISHSIEEYKLLKNIWEASSDYLMALKNDDFRDTHGLDYLMEKMVNAVDEYESRDFICYD